MRKNFYLIVFIFCSQLQALQAQTIYVDAVNGNDHQAGQLATPLQSIDQAVQIANALTGQGNIIIKLMPGTYVLDDKIAINPIKMLKDTARYIIEAHIMPSDSDWIPEKMPIIQSVSANNSDTQFPHSTGFLVASSHVTIRGLKFLGNANPEVPFYYPITRENPALQDMVVSQCLFIAEQNSTAIQGGVWAQGQTIDINHCVFKACRNAILVFQNIDGCSIRNNIIYGAYESAFWIGENKADFTFTNNVISGCHYFWTNSFEGNQTYRIQNSVIVDTDHYVGRWNREKQGLGEMMDHKLKEEGVKKKGEIQFVERQQPLYPSNYLHLLPESIGYDLNAGLFKR